LILNVALKSLYIHEVGSKRITSMPTTAAVDDVIEMSSKTYDVKKQVMEISSEIYDGKKAR